MKKYNNINPEEVKAFINEVETSKNYDRKKITKFHDKIFGKNERSDSDDSCLLIQMMQIKAWYQDQERK